MNEDGFREVLGAAEGMKEDQGQLGQLLPVATRIGRCEAHCRRQVYGDAGGRWRGVPGRQIPALHGAFLPQRFLCCAQIQGQNCGENAQGDPRPGEQKGIPREGKGRGRRAESDEAEKSGKEDRGRH